MLTIKYCTMLSTKKKSKLDEKGFFSFETRLNI